MSDQPEAPGPDGANLDDLLDAIEQALDYLDEHGWSDEDRALAMRLADVIFERWMRAQDDVERGIGPDGL